MDSRKHAVPLPQARGLNRVQAAHYVGVSPAYFDQLVQAGSMPQPKRFGTRTIYDVRALDIAFDLLGDDAVPNEWSAVLQA